jgi:hypothetical protein
MTTGEALVRAGRRQKENPYELARIAFVASVLDADLVSPRHWLPVALARLGDRRGATLLCRELAATAISSRAKRDTAATMRDVAAVLGEAPSRPILTLDELRRAGDALLHEVVALVTPKATGRQIPCPKCKGEGDIAEYVHIAAGLCFLCYGRRTIREYAAAL